jgi:hypothetical protein
MLDARVLDVDVLDGYLIDLLWRPVLLQVPALRASYDDSRTTRTPPTNSSSSTSWIFLWSWLRTLSRQERVELLRLGTLLVAGTTPASKLLGLQWKEGNSTWYRNTAFPRLWGYCLLRAASVAFRRYRVHVKRMLVNHQTRPEQERGDAQLQQQQLRALRLQEGLLRIVHKVLAAARLAVLFGATLWDEPDGASSHVPLPSPNRYGLAMLLSGNAYGDASGDGTPLLHVDYAHRRWLWREGSTAVQLLFAGIISSTVLREAWQPLLRRMYEQCRDAFEGSISALLVKWNDQNRFDSKHGSRSLVASSKDEKHAPRSCPLCGTSPVRIPVRADCGHVYCYVCLYRRSLRRVVGGTPMQQQQQQQHRGNDDESRQSTSTATGKGTAAPVGPFRCRVCRNPVTYAVPIP